MFRISQALAACLALCCLPTTSFAYQMADYMVTFPEPGKVQVTYRLPSPNVAKNSSDEFELGCPLDEGFSNPNLICYDQKYLEQFVKEKMNGQIVCGAGEYTVVSTDGKEISVRSGLDESYLGKKFREADLIKYLQRRIVGNSIAKQITTTIAENQAQQFKTSKLWFAKKFNYSPWERDTSNIISLLSKSQLKSAVPVLVELTKDPSETVRNQATMGLGKLSQEHDSAAQFLFERLSDRDPKISSTALNGLRYGKGKAIPYLVKAMKNRFAPAFDSLPQIENSLTVAEEGWLVALKSTNQRTRKAVLIKLYTYKQSHPQETIPDTIENFLSNRVDYERETKENRQLVRSILDLIYKDVPAQVEIN